jgi:hypothetical protein
MAATALPIVATAVVELAKLGLQIYFLAMATAGKTPEEIDALYKEQQAYFIAHPPETLPDV